MLGAEGRQAAKEAGADGALIACWQNSEHERAREKAAEALVNVRHHFESQFERLGVLHAACCC